jgi:hypothetical protein
MKIPKEWIISYRRIILGFVPNMPVDEIPVLIYFIVRLQDAALPHPAPDGKLSRKEQQPDPGNIYDDTVDGRFASPAGK